MKYADVTDTTYKGLDITIYAMERGDFIADVKKPCGELIYGWECLSSHDIAMEKATSFIDLMPMRGYK